MLLSALLILTFCSALAVLPSSCSEYEHKAGRGSSHSVVLEEKKTSILVLCEIVDKVYPLRTQEADTFTCILITLNPCFPVIYTRTHYSLIYCLVNFEP